MNADKRSEGVKKSENLSDVYGPLTNFIYRSTKLKQSFALDDGEVDVTGGADGEDRAHDAYDGDGLEGGSDVLRRFRFSSSEFGLGLHFMKFCLLYSRNRILSQRL